MIVVFVVCNGALLAAALVVGRHRLALRTVERVGAAVTPFLYMAIGVAVLLRSGTFGHL